MGICAIFRGDVVPKDVNAAAKAIKNLDAVRIIEWCPTGFKSGVNPQPPTVVPGLGLAKISRSVTKIANNTAIGDVFSAMDRRSSFPLHPCNPQLTRLPSEKTRLATSPPSPRAEMLFASPYGPSSPRSHADAWDARGMIQPDRFLSLFVDAFVEWHVQV